MPLEKPDSWSVAFSCLRAVHIGWEAVDCLLLTWKVLRWLVVGAGSVVYLIWW